MCACVRACVHALHTLGSRGALDSLLVRLCLLGFPSRGRGGAPGVPPRGRVQSPGHPAPWFLVWAGPPGRSMRRELHFGGTSLLGSAPSSLRTAVIYNGCPRAFEAGIWWPQTKFGQPAAVPCPKGSVGKYHGVWPAAPMGDRTLGPASGSRESWPRRQNSPVVVWKWFLQPKCWGESDNVFLHREG